MAQTILAAYLRDAGKTQKQFADEIGRKQATVSRILAGARRVSMDTAIRIERATAGRVPVSAWADADGVS